jgi:hypothetical protein
MWDGPDLANEATLSPRERVSTYTSLTFLSGRLRTGLPVAA